MGNYVLVSKKKIVNHNKADISQQFVHIVSCKGCSTVLSTRGCQLCLNSNLSVVGYSTDLMPQTLNESKQFQKCKDCNCLITKGYCKKCKKQCALHSIYLCQYCQTQPTNGHCWIFLDSNGKKTEKTWSELQQIQPTVRPQFYQLLKFIGIHTQTMEILKKQQITNSWQLNKISDQLLRQSGICLGQIAKLRLLK